jgi:hypothetical protein
MILASQHNETAARKKSFSKSFMMHSEIFGEKSMPPTSKAGSSRQGEKSERNVNCGV